MKWTASNIKLPVDSEEIIIKYNGIFYLAVFNAEQNIFVTKSGLQFIPGDRLLWARLLSDIKAAEESITH
jgi:hypothetical protein